MKQNRYLCKWKKNGDYCYSFFFFASMNPKARPITYNLDMLPELLQVFAQNSSTPTFSRSVLAHNPPTPAFSRS